MTAPCERFVVHTEQGERDCECLDTHEYSAPCCHLLAVIMAQNLTVEDFFDPAYLTDSYREIYMEPLYALSIGSLISSADTPTSTSAFRVSKGRPKEKRYRKEAWGS